MTEDDNDYNYSIENNENNENYNDDDGGSYPASLATFLEERKG